MTVYYIASEEKPQDATGVKFYTDHASALAAASEMRGSVYQFNVNDKCDTNSFGMDTQMLFSKESETGELKFVASGRWVEIHDIMNVPFYYDFEVRSKSYVSMSLRYFLSHYKIVPVDNTISVKSSGVQNKPKSNLSIKPVENNLKEDLVGNKADYTPDYDVIGELFGV